MGPQHCKVTKHNTKSLHEGLKGLAGKIITGITKVKLRKYMQRGEGCPQRIATRILKCKETIVVPKNAESHASGPFNFDQKSKSPILVMLQSLIFFAYVCFSAFQVAAKKSTVFHTLPSCAKNETLK